MSMVSFPQVITHDWENKKMIQTVILTKSSAHETQTDEFLSVSSCFAKTPPFPLLLSSLHQLRPLLPSRHATWTPSPPRCVCSSRSEKCARRSCRRPLRAPTSSRRRPMWAPLRPNAPRSISQAERTAGRSSKGMAAAAPRSRKVKDPKAEGACF